MPSILCLLLLLSSHAFACSPPFIVSCKPGEKTFSINWDRFSEIVKKSASRFKPSKKSLGSSCEGVDTKTIFLKMFQERLKQSNEICESQWKQLESYCTQEELDKLKLPRF